MRCDNLVGRDAALDPLLERPNLVELISGALATLAVGHSRHHEEPVEVFSRPSIAHPRDDAVVIIDAVLRCNLLVVPAVILEELATALFERAEVGVGRVELTGFRINSVGLDEIAIEIERSEIPVQIAEDYVLVVALGD